MAAAAAPCSRPRSRCRYALLGIAFCAVSYTTIWGDEYLGIPLSENFHLRRWRRRAGRRRELAYLDSEPSSLFRYGRSVVDPNYQSLVQPSRIDGSLIQRLSREGQGSPEKGYDSSTACDNIFVLMPDSFGHNGHGSQLNNYILAAMIATFTDRALVILEPPPALNNFKSNSQFGCPKEAWQYAKVRAGGEPKKLGWNKDLPIGLSRLVKHPAWLSRQCAVPCQQYSYEDWEELRLVNNFEEVPIPQEITCPANANGGQSYQNAIVLGGQQVRDYFETHFKAQMMDRDEIMTTPAAEWASRLGATPNEARAFGSLTDRHEIWDYISALMNRAGIMRFQPWIARDVEDHINQIEDMPLDAPYDAIHVRRGDKLESDAKRFVKKYWESEGKETQEVPRNYIPLVFYLRQFDEKNRKYDEAACTGEEPVRLVYVATDDPTTVQSEVNEFPRDAEGNSIVNSVQSCCNRFRFFFGTSPSEQNALVSYHIDEGPSKGDCEERYRRNIACIADLMILAKADIFIGEFNSNWGRLVRTFRLRLNTSGKWARPVLLKEMRVAWGSSHPGPPGW